MIIYTLYDYFKLYPYVIKQWNYGLKDNSQNYSLEIIRTRMKNIKGKIEKVGVPKVIPLVIYTGQAKWTAKNKLEEVQVEFEHFNGIDVITGYNLIDIRNEEEGRREGMLHAQEVIRRNFENAKKKAIKEGLEEGRKEGIMYNVPIYVDTIKEGYPILCA